MVSERGTSKLYIVCLRLFQQGHTLMFSSLACRGGGACVAHVARSAGITAARAGYQHVKMLRNLSATAAENEAAFRSSQVWLPTRAPDWGDTSRLSAEAKKLNGKAQSGSLKDMTAAELELGGEMYRQATTAEHLASRATDMLLLGKGAHMELGFAVDLYTHALQSATRAFKDGADDEMVVCALLHDLGEMLSPSNHGDIAAAILRPYISRKMHWVLANHEVFQGYYYFGKVGLDPLRRDQLKSGGGAGSGVADPLSAGAAPDGAYELCVEFCEKYDMPSFDPDFESMCLEEF